MSPVLRAGPDALGAITFAGPMLLALPVAALAGLVSFASPCVLPLVPGYLGYVTGLAGATAPSPAPPGPAALSPVESGPTGEAGKAGVGGLAGRDRRTLLAGAGLFVLGFSVVFIVIGFSAGVLGGLLAQWASEIARVLGVLVVVLGLAFAGVLPALPGLGRTATARVRPRPGLAGAPLLGVTFGLGWTPCMGPTLAAITSLAFVSGSGTRSIVLAAAYAAGLGIPFVLVALAAARGARGLEVLRRHRLALVRAGGALLVVVGVLLVTGVWGQWTSALGARFASWALL